METLTREQMKTLLEIPAAFEALCELGTATCEAERDRIVVKLRREFFEPKSLGDRLKRTIEGRLLNDPETLLIMETIERLNKLEKAMTRRPLSELRQEPRKGGGPDRWILLWGPSGYEGTEWRCHVGRLMQRYDENEARWHNQFETVSGDRFTDDGPEATHFSELHLFSDE